MWKKKGGGGGGGGLAFCMKSVRRVGGPCTYAKLKLQFYKFCERETKNMTFFFVIEALFILTFFYWQVPVCAYVCMSIL